MIHSSSLPLFADIGQYNTLEETKTIMSALEAEDYLLSLGSLLDRGNAESIEFEQYLIEAIPFKGEYCSGEVSLTSQDLENPVADSLTCSKIFYVSTLDTETDTTDLMVVTMIPDYVYLSSHKVTDIKYLDKANYSGLILYSEIDGSFREACYFKEGLMVPVSPVESGDSVQNSGKVHYLAVYQSSGTKSMARDRSDRYTFREEDDDDCGGAPGAIKITEPAICTGYKTTKEPDVIKDPEEPKMFSDSDDIGRKDGGGGYTINIINTRIGIANRKAITRSEKQRYTVSLSAQRISPGESCGTVSGSGTYTKGSFVCCQASANSSYVFDGWTGNMPGSGPWVCFEISTNISATATFFRKVEKQTKRPCWDYNTNIANPLLDMIVAPTNSGLLDNGVFNLYNPNRVSKTHQGIDLAAEVGTPIYAPCDGVISKNSAFVTGQPQRSSEEWPDGYTGDKDKAGNRFYLDCTLPSGEKITYAFWHLQAGTPVAINPRTGKTFARGDEVYQGDIIGYVGRTGNAYDVDNTHLHLGVRNSSGKWIDPEPYLNGVVQRNGSGTVTQAKFQSVKCYDKSILDNYEYGYTPSPTTR